VCFIYVGRIGELRLLADSFAKDNILLEKKDLPFPSTRRHVRYFRHQKRTVQQEFPLRRYFTLKKKWILLFFFFLVTNPTYLKRIFRRMFLSYVNLMQMQWRKRATLTSKPCNLPTSIISFAALGITRMTWAAALRPSISDNLWVRSVRRSASRRRSWYFVILCTGLINKSQSCRRWPSFCRSSYNTHMYV